MGLQDICRQSVAPFISLKQAVLHLANVMLLSLTRTILGVWWELQTSPNALLSQLTELSTNARKIQAGMYPLSSFSLLYRNRKFSHVSTPSC